MLRLLIVDDEPIIADGLYNEFLEQIHLDLDVYRVYSGRAVLEFLDRTKVDIIISDIRMPGIDGLLLLERIRNSWPDCKVIFLTGYKEFDYAYQAIQNGAVKYLLKTEGYAKVVEAVEDVICEIEASLKQLFLVEHANLQLNEVSSLLQKDCMTALLRGETIADDALRQEWLDRAGMGLKSDYPILLAMGKFDALPMGLSYREKTKLFNALKLIAGQYLSPFIEAAHMVDDHYKVIWFMQPKRIQEETSSLEGASSDMWSRSQLFVKNTLETIQRSCWETLGLTISFVLHSKPTDWGHIVRDNRILDLLMDYRFGSGTEMLLTDQSVDMDKLQPYNPDILNYQVHANKYAELEHYLEKGKRESFRFLFLEITNNLSQLTGKDYPQAQQIYYTVSLLFLSYANRWNLHSNLPLMTDIHNLFRTEAHASWKDAVQGLERVALLLFTFQEDEQKRRTDDTVTKIKKYIANHMQEDLSLVRLAELVYFNPSYLSRLFKQHTGLNVSDYIQEAKVKRAMELLRRNDLKINDISEALGFGSPSNFARSFKKLTGMSPLDFRDSTHR
jgi:two-component system response regulator YesN